MTIYYNILHKLVLETPKTLLFYAVTGGGCAVTFLKCKETYIG